MTPSGTTPVALTIAGSDSGGGAGIQADLKTFAAFGVHGTSAIACLTAQNPQRVLAVSACSPLWLIRQIEAVFEELPPRAVKTGMLYSAANLRAVAAFWAAQPRRRRAALVVDPVMVSTSGAALLAPAAQKVLVQDLLPLASVITPNLDEVAVLLGKRPQSPKAMVDAARELHQRCGCAVLVKGGHLTDNAQAIDIFFDGQIELKLSAGRIPGLRTHGTGCTYSAAICAALACGHDLPAAVQIAKRFITCAIANSYRIGRHFALDPMAVRPARRWRAGFAR